MDLKLMMTAHMDYAARADKNARDHFRAEKTIRSGPVRYPVIIRYPKG